MFRNRLQCLLFFISIAGTTGMNMSVENNMLHLLCQTKLYAGQLMVYSFFFFASYFLIKNSTFVSEIK